MKKMFLLLVIILLIFSTGCRKKTTEEVQPEFRYTIKTGLDTIELNETWTDAGVDMYFNNVLTDYTIKSNTINNTEVGNYKVEYKATLNNKEYVVIRYVAVVDDTKPVITLNPGIDTIVVGENWIDAGVVVTDNSKEVINYQVSGDVDSQRIGRYVVTYTAKDPSNNETSIKRIVNVVE